MRRILALFVIAAIVPLSGCFAPTDAPPTSEPPLAFEPCVHPYPCGNEWPNGLAGPFALKEILAPDLRGHDGTPLEGYVFLPDLPAGLGAPVVIFSTPYPGTCASNSGYYPCGQTGDNAATSSRIDVTRLVEAGYAVAMVNVRGTGNSGGCFEVGGPNERKDQAALVDWMAAQEWSNGRISMLGHSYSSFTVWMGAIENPPALKTVIGSGHMTDLYTTVHTPQGAAMRSGGTFLAQYAISLGLIPPLGGTPEHWSIDHAVVLPERVCPGVLETITETQRSAAVDDRSAAFWDERRFIDRIPGVTSAAFVVSGFEDSPSLFHAFQDDELWRVLGDSPKRFLYGHWGHNLPPPSGNLEDAPWGPDWYDDALIPWLDFWLKGLGDAPPRLGMVDFEDSTGTWRTATSWPPPETRSEVLYLSGDSLTPTPGGADRSFRSFPGPSTSPERLEFASEPRDGPVRIVGSLFAFLRLSSDLPGGIVSVDIYDEGPSGRVALAAGAADLRFHSGSFQGTDFPTNSPTMVRIDINNQAWTIEPDHRLVVVVTDATGARGRIGQPFAPIITVHGEGEAEASHVVVPVVDGSFGGLAPALEYPPRPFAPAM